MGVVKIFLYGCPNSVLHQLDKNYKCSFKFAKIIVKNLLASFLWTDNNAVQSKKFYKKIPYYAVINY